MVDRFDVSSRDLFSPEAALGEHQREGGCRQTFARRAAHAKALSAALRMPDGELDRKIEQSNKIIDKALVEHGNATHLFGLFSSGNDSVCSTHLSSTHPAFAGAVMIDTTIAIPEAQEHGRGVADVFGWGLREYRPPASYREVVLEHGFPGPGAHRTAYIRLKERCIRQLVSEHKQKHFDRIGLVTGVRLSESARRMGHAKPVQREGAQLWISPILYWEEKHKVAYMLRHRLPRNPVTEKLGVSGECLCGAFAKKDELGQIAEHYPETAAEIMALQAEARERGVHCVWGTRPPGGRKKPSVGGPLCSDCNQRAFDFVEDA